MRTKSSKTHSLGLFEGQRSAVELDSLRRRGQYPQRTRCRPISFFYYNTDTNIVLSLHIWHDNRADDYDWWKNADLNNVRADWDEGIAAAMLIKY
ncbi:MAG: hypothetical protein HWN70_08705 [Desulfobacterales bacterium]|nr:hypothetical protein [Desulfobacterales bacterium]